MQWFRAPFPQVSGHGPGGAGRRGWGVDRDEHEQLSPAGQIDSWGDLASGLRSHRAGRRRALRMLAWLAALLVVVAAVLLLGH
jgi:hypothetical protein